MTNRLYCVFGVALFVGTAAYSEGLAPGEALRQMTTASGFNVKLVASEPEIRQPLSISFDDRGRMWVIQYLQYPAPAGLKPVKVDQYLRTTYDKIPEPPPRGPKGADRITICEDMDGDGKARRFKDFLSDLNLCSGMAIGHGGVFVMQPPYLLFYADRNHDDVPDGDPEVLLSGFGMDDAHALANSLTWGPDGWLYGAEGSTVTSVVRGTEFQQGIWRYHPLTHEFELFAEGGGNTWGMDFDKEGEILAGTNFEDKMLHQVQGAYYLKNFGKHGELHNPHAYGYFGHVPYSGYRGKHISAGGISYQGGAFPKSFNGAYIFANTLDNAVYWADLRPDGSSFTASFGGTLLKTDDVSFRPVDCETGPDGSVYIADWYDKRATHVDPLDTWDRSNGRIYKIEAEGTPVGPKFDLQKLSSVQLVDLLSKSNDWFARRALCLLAERRDANVLPRLGQQVFESHNPHLQLESLWALYVTGGFTDSVAAKGLQHTNANIRKWTVRLLGDKKEVSDEIAKSLRSVARTESSAVVRAQLASSARRLPGRAALPIIRELLLHTEDLNDQHVPLLIWWALEAKAISHRAEVMKVFRDDQVWNSALVQKEILGRLARRYASENSDGGFASCALLLQRAGNSKAGALESVLAGMDEGLAGRTLEAVPAPLVPWFAAHAPGQDVKLIRVGLRLGNEAAQKAAWEAVNNPKIPEQDRAAIIELLGEARRKEFFPDLLKITESDKSEKLRLAALSALQHGSEPQIATGLIELYPGFSPRLRQRTIQILASRSAWATRLVSAVEQGGIPSKEISLEEARHITGHNDAALSRRVEKIWGKIQAGASAEKQSRINELKLVLKPSGVAGRVVKGRPAEGKQIFQQACAVCHTLFGEGNTLGPDLTALDRKDTDNLLVSIVNPSAYIRNEYVSFEIKTRDDQTVSGLMAESSAHAVTLLDRNNQRHTIARDQIAELNESQVSLMPEGLLDVLQPQQIIDLFSYLQMEPEKPR